MTTAEYKSTTTFDATKNIIDTPPPVVHYPINDSRGDAVSANNR
jgi:hypothetical protein